MDGLSGFPTIWRVVTLSAFRAWNPAPGLPSVQQLSLCTFPESQSCLTLSLIYPPALSLFGGYKDEYNVSAKVGGS